MPRRSPRSARTASTHGEPQRANGAAVLLDRLTDDEPGKTVESRERRVLSLRTLREGVLRDLAWLLITTNLVSLWSSTAGTLPHLPPGRQFRRAGHSGPSIASLNVSALERGIRQAIWDFEPRLIRATVSVRASAGQVDTNKLTFEIEADLWAQPYPERLYLKTELDLERGVMLLEPAPERRMNPRFCATTARTAAPARSGGEFAQDFPKIAAASASTASIAPTRMSSGCWKASASWPRACS
jgi:type VI secretion system protein ImpF